MAKYRAIRIRLLSFLIQAFKIFFYSPHGVCKFHPSCSEYALQAFRHHSFFYALYLTTFRILRCNPFSKGGIDPIPNFTKEKK